MKSYPALLLPFLIVSPVNAANISFMPGDAFFHALLTEKPLESACDDGIRLEYAYAPGSGNFGGYAGFRKLAISGDTSKLSRNLRQVYRALRKQYHKELSVRPDGSTVETNGFHLFVYNSDVEWSSGVESQRLGMKYNESWAHLPESAFQSETRKLSLGQNKAHEYQTFVNIPDAIIHDWKYAKRFDGLDVTIPEGVGWGITGPRIKAAASIDVANIQVVIVPESNLKPYFRMRPNRAFYVVTNDGVTRKRFKRDKVASEKWGPQSD